MTSTITIARRFCGPPNSGNGGYSAGLLAQLIDGPTEVTLRSPPPLDRQLKVERDDAVRVFDGEQLVLEGVSKELDLEVPPAPSWDEAGEMSKAYLGFEGHVFPTCFTCGPERDEGDGLRIFAGRSGRDGQVAAPWTPDESMADDGIVKPPIVWAALDCPGYFAIAHRGEVAMLGRMHAHLREPLQQTQRYVVTAWPISREARKLRAGTAVFRADGTCIGSALQTWILVAPS